MVQKNCPSTIIVRGTFNWLEIELYSEAWRSLKELAVFGDTMCMSIEVSATFLVAVFGSLRDLAISLDDHL